jgi:hypothetical protein
MCPLRLWIAWSGHCLDSDFLRSFECLLLECGLCWQWSAIQPRFSVRWCEKLRSQVWHGCLQQPDSVPCLKNARAQIWEQTPGCLPCLPTRKDIVGKRSRRLSWIVCRICGKVKRHNPVRLIGTSGAAVGASVFTMWYYVRASSSEDFQDNGDHCGSRRLRSTLPSC